MCRVAYWYATADLGDDLLIPVHQRRPVFVAAATDVAQCSSKLDLLAARWADAREWSAAAEWAQADARRIQHDGGGRGARGD